MSSRGHAVAVGVLEKVTASLVGLALVWLAVVALGSPREPTPAEALPKPSQMPGFSLVREGTYPVLAGGEVRMVPCQWWLGDATGMQLTVWCGKFSSQEEAWEACPKGTYSSCHLQVGTYSGEPLGDGSWHEPTALPALAGISFYVESYAVSVTAGAGSEPLDPILVEDVARIVLQNIENGGAP